MSGVPVREHTGGTQCTARRGEGRDGERERLWNVSRKNIGGQKSEPVASGGDRGYQDTESWARNMEGSQEMGSPVNHRAKQGHNCPGNTDVPTAHIGVEPVVTGAGRRHRMELGKQ